MSGGRRQVLLTGARACLGLAAAGLVPACRRRLPLGPLRIAVAADPVTLDPHLHNDVETQVILANLYEGLTSFDAEMAVRPGLAASWENASELVWRMRLRPAWFHDGRPVRAQDAKASLDRARRLGQSKVAPLLVAVDEVTVVDERTVEVATRRPSALLPIKLASVAILPADSPEQVTQPVGTGPYRFVSRQVARSLDLAAFERHWAGPPAEAAVRFLVVPDAHLRAELALRREVDLGSNVPFDALPGLPAASGLRVSTRSTLSVSVLGGRLDAGPFSQAPVRQAIDRALDRAALAAAVLLGHGRPAGQLVAQPVFGFVPPVVASELAPASGDPEAARRLLAAAGHAGGLELTLEHPVQMEAYAAPLVEQLARAGIRVRPLRRAWDDLYRRLVTSAAGFFLIGFACQTGDASDLFDAVIHTRDAVRGYGAHNFAAYSNARVDALIEQSAETMIVPRRLAQLRSAMRLVMADLPLVPLLTPECAFLATEDLEWQPRLDRGLWVAGMRRRR